MTATVPAILKHLKTNQDYIMDQNQNIETPQRVKKRRLDHLSWEEKMQRKKLKNRMAAQTSRDRKKAKMEQMEDALKQVFTQNERLIGECESLKQANSKLTEETEELRKRLEAPCACRNQNRTVECEALDGSTESLLQPKGSATHSAAALDQRQTKALLGIVLTYLLYRTCSMSSTQKSTSTLWNNLRRVSCKTSPETWRQLLKKRIVRKKELIGNKAPTARKWWGRHQKSWNPVDAVMC